jgi:aspartate racemase
VKVIGLLGGMSWESSHEYHRIVHERVRERLGGLHSAHCVLYSVDFAGIEALQVSGDWDEAARQLDAAVRALRAAGADFLVLCTNTMHKVADQLTGLPLLHIGDATAAAVRAAGLTRVGLLGTGFTMAQSFYRDRLAGHDLDVLVPDQADRADVHRIIYDELVVGVVTESSRQRYREVIARLVERGAEGVILGCTEIELLVDQSDSPVPVFPTTRLHAELAVDHALGLAELPRGNLRVIPDATGRDAT